MSISPLLSALFGMLKLVNCSYSRLIPSGASFSLMGFQMSSYTLPVRPIFTVTGFSGEYAVSASAALSALSEFSAVAALSAAEESAELSAAEEEPEEIVPEKEEEKSGDWRDHILDEMKEAEEATKKNVPSKEERGVKTDDSKEMSEADCRELWKLIKEMDREFREMKQIADEWLMVNGRKDGCLGVVLAAMLLPAGAIYGIWSLF